MGKQYVIYRFTKPSSTGYSRATTTTLAGNRRMDSEYGMEKIVFCRLSLDEYSRRGIVVVVDVNDRRIRDWRARRRRFRT